MLVVHSLNGPTSALLCGLCPLPGILIPVGPTLQHHLASEPEQTQDTGAPTEPQGKEAVGRRGGRRDPGLWGQARGFRANYHLSEPWFL